MGKPMIQCQRCDDDGRMLDGTTCGSCMGAKWIAARCEVCRTGEYAVGYNDAGQPVCVVCDATNNRAA